MTKPYLPGQLVLTSLELGGWLTVSKCNQHTLHFVEGGWCFEHEVLARVRNPPPRKVSR